MKSSQVTPPEKSLKPDFLRALEALVHQDFRGEVRADADAGVEVARPVRVPPQPTPVKPKAARLPIEKCRELLGKAKKEAGL